ncbi:hypothetical protein LPB72_06485 [Hydrogenophaga crassostreae]|uniref:Protoporphyrinogen IX oxidase n=1 Tax=Hydrogenophaga crassostreae TaxID=1763535 RepID=A0A162Z1H2_9BURK|nr:CopD family protein [Hydrogenophaga crassostreae]AOW14157.1 hypothetical protein LPB072_16230 [Hydrogenophaga crassostreae]OAD42914.1 hypothetical protein LPB72_06485 [Hydrogenophaga crassostreae]
MTYLWIKGLHLAAAFAWVGGLLMLGVALRVWQPAGVELSPQERCWGQAVQRWDRRVTVPAMLAVWAFGISLAMLGSWFGAVWLTLKFAIVLVLSGLHGILSGTLRRRLEPYQGADGHPWLRLSPAFTVTVAGLIAFLVILKPSF